jgi:hypothetical protein
MAIRQSTGQERRYSDDPKKLRNGYASVSFHPPFIQKMRTSRPIVANVAQFQLSSKVSPVPLA